MNADRTKPYEQLSRVMCCHCGKRPADQQWSITLCANKRRIVWVAVCNPCDIEFNDRALEFINHPHRERLMKDYREKMA